MLLDVRVMGSIVALRQHRGTLKMLRVYVASRYTNARANTDIRRPTPERNPSCEPESLVAYATCEGIRDVKPYVSETEEPFL